MNSLRTVYRIPNYSVHFFMARRKRTPRRYVPRRRRRVARRRMVRRRLSRRSGGLLKRSYYAVLNRPSRNKYVTVRGSQYGAHQFAGSNAAYGGNLIFDVSTGANRFGNWPYYAGLYHFWKVKSIKVTFRVVSASNANSAIVSYPTILCRTSYDADLGSTSHTLAYFEGESGTRRFTFSDQRTAFQHCLFPRVLRASAYDSSVTTDVFEPAKMRWSDTDSAIPYLYGVEYVFDYLSSNFGVWIDIEWNLKFKGPRNYSAPVLAAGAVEEIAQDAVDAISKE